MSTIRVDNFGPSAGGTTYSAGGVAKLWVNFNGTGTVAVRDSLNASSITDNGTAVYTVNFSSSMSNGNYGITVGNARAFAWGTVFPQLHTDASFNESAPTSSSFITSIEAYNSGRNDNKYVYNAIHGDLA